MRLRQLIILLLGTMASLPDLGHLGLAQHPEPGMEQAAKDVLATRGSDWTVGVEPDSTLRIYHKGSLVIDMANIYCGPNWKWATPSFKCLTADGKQYSVAGESVLLKLKVSGKIAFTASNVVEMDYQITASEDVPMASGSGWQWNFKLDSPSLGHRLSAPELLPNETGWTLTTAPGQAITLRFREPIAKVYYEMNRKEAVRTFFLWNGVRTGSHVFHATLKLPEGASHALSHNEHYGNPDTSSWFKNALGWDTSPVDLSFLNRDDRPAGRHGLAKANADDLVFEDGTPARFWALTWPQALCSPRLDKMFPVKHTAWLSLATTSCELCTLMPRGRSPISLSIMVGEIRRHLEPKSVDSLDWWIKCLKDEGIYVWLDMVYTRTLTQNDGVTAGFDEIKRNNGHFFGFNYFNQDIQRLMREFQHQYLSHVNPYTRLAYKDDPAVMAVLITNENDLTAHFGNLMLPDKNNPVHNALFTRDYKAFARKHELAENRVWQTWLPGPSKLYLNDVEHQFNQTMIQDLRNLGVKAPIATTHYWGGESLFSLPSLTDGDVIDVHTYGTSEAMSANPRYNSNYLAWITAAHVYGDPLTITEWNVPYPEVDRFTGPLYLASIATLQG